MSLACMTSFSVNPHMVSEKMFKYFSKIQFNNILLHNNIAMVLGHKCSPN